MVNWEDRDTCVLFGDGAGAVVLGPSEGGRGLLHACLRSNGAHTRLLYNPGCGSLNPPTVDNVREKLHTIHMEGRDVFRHAVTSMTEALRVSLDATGMSVDDLDLLIPHQANLRIIEMVAHLLRTDMSKVFINLDRYGNTSAGTIPLALDEAVRAGRIQRGDLVLMPVFGGGLTWGATLLRW